MLVLKRRDDIMDGEEIKKKCPCCESEYEHYDYYNPMDEKRDEVWKCKSCGYIEKVSCDAYANVISRTEYYPNHDEFNIRLPIIVNGITYETKYDVINALESFK
jgi:uncharacterized Zn finger protein